ncbi:MAG: Maf family protein [Gammaproteobacteria bacterium]|nr:Maf family protein [Gammaproteobacteria bacterium]
MLILASESPRRRMLLAQLGVAFRVEIAAVDERRLAGESPAEMSVRLALLKARSVAARLGVDGDSGGGRDPGRDSGRDTPGNPGAIGDAEAAAVLAGDTVVAIGDESLGKPADRAHAVAMLRRLSGATHTVYSAVALLAGARAAHRLSATAVTFAGLDARDIEQYCDTDEPYDKAGGYGIQGPAGAFVTRIDGSYSGVVGLPLWETRALLRELRVARA